MLSYALGTMSIASGFHVRTNNYCETAFGNYNQTNTANSTFGNAGNTHFSIGIGAGSNDYNTKNAIEVMQNGDLYAYGVGNYDGTNYTSAHTLAYVINDIQTTLGTAASVASLIVGE